MRNLPIATLSVPTGARSEMIAITREVAQRVTQANVRQGMAIIHIPHTTAAITINENADPDVRCDMLRKLEELIPQREPYYRHAEGNSDSHIKASLVGSSATVLVEEGELVLGQWQGIYLCEFDGPRQRQVMIKIVDFSADEQTSHGSGARRNPG